MTNSLTFQIKEDQIVLPKVEPSCVSADEIYSLVFEGSLSFRGRQLSSPPDFGRLKFSRYPASLELEIDYRAELPNSGLVCRIVAVAGDQRHVLQSLRQRTADHLVIAGCWHPFAAGARDEILNLLESCGIADSGPLTLRQYFAIRKRVGTADWLLDKTADRVIHPGIDVRQDDSALALFVGDLYSYQKAGWQWLSFICREQFGGILADEMGLGKTIQIIALLASHARDNAAPSLIAAPSTILENWRREIWKFAPSLKTLVHQGPQRTGDPNSLLQMGVIITSYETIVRDLSMLRMIEWPIVILDEAQAIKNPETMRAKAVKYLRRKVGIAVTGTPIENHVRDLWSIADFVLPGYLEDEASFEQQFSDDIDSAARLEPLVSPIMLRRRVAEVAQDLPPRIDIPQVLTLTEDEAVAYERIRQQIAMQYGQSATLVALGYLRMFCAHPLLVEGNAYGSAELANFGKFQRLLEIAEEVFANQEKLLIFTSYNKMIDLIVHALRCRFGVFAENLDGRKPINERQTLVDRFSAQNEGAALVLNPRAGGTGLNITAATHVIHYNLEWNPAVEDQASARAYRRGQDRPVTIHRFYYADTVEEVVNNRLERKRGVAETAVVDTEEKQGNLKDIMRALRLSPIR